MADRRKWNWDVSGFETRRASEQHQDGESIRASVTPMVRRYSVAASSPVLQHELPVRQGLVAKVQKLKDKVKLAREDYVELRQEATELQEYSNVKLDRVMRYLGVLADKSHLAALDMEAKISPLISEKKRLFNDLLTAKGNVKVFCRTRPAFVDEGPSIVEFPDDFTIRVKTGDETATSPKKDFEFDRVYGPHVGQSELFLDVQSLVQSALDGYNVSVFAYGQRGSGKTHTMEGTINDRGLYARCFEELFDLSNTDVTCTSQYNFYASVFEIYNKQMTDLLSELRERFRPSIGEYGFPIPTSIMEDTTSLPELVKEKVYSPLDFTRVVKAALKNRGVDALKHGASHMVVTIHIHCKNSLTGENLHSKLSLVDLAGSNSVDMKADNGEYVADVLHALKSLSALGDVMSSLTSKKDVVPYENSILTEVLADSLGGSAKTLMIIHLCPNATSLSETLATLNFASRARNTTLSLGSEDTIKWRDIANDAQKQLYEKEKEIQDLKQEVLGLKQALKNANDQCNLLVNEVQKHSKNVLLEEKYKIEKDQNEQLRNQLTQLLQLEQDQKIQIQQQETTIKTLQNKIQSMGVQLAEVLQSNESRAKSGSESGPAASKVTDDNEVDSSTVISKLQEEIQKRDQLIERLHNENEKLFSRLTEKAASAPPPQLALPAPNGFTGGQAQDSGRCDKNKGQSPAAQSPRNKPDGTLALTKTNSEGVKSTPAGEYLTAALNDFDPEQFDSLAAISDGANKLLMLVLAAVIKAGASREHEILAEIRDAVFSFIRKMEPRRVMDTMLVSRVRILYIRSLLARAPELQSIKVPPVDRFLEKPNTIHGKNASRGGSPGRSSPHYDSSSRNAIVEEHYIHAFRVNIKQEKTSKLSSVVLKLRGIDHDSWKQQVTGGKLREITEEAKGFAIGNKALAALFVHTPAGELQRQIRAWLAEHFEFLTVTGDDAVGGSAGQLELLSTAIMDGWMAGLGAAMPPRTDALGQLLSEYARRVFTSQLQHLKDIAGTLAMEEAEDSPQVAKLRSALESVDHKRRKLLQQIKTDAAMLNVEEGSVPIQHPSTAAEDARLASLISLDGVLKQVKEIVRQASVTKLSKSKKRALLEALDELTDRMPSLLDIDQPCAQRQIADAREMVESIPEDEDRPQPTGSFPLLDLSPAEIDVSQWNVLQFNTGSTSPFIIKCGANSNSELVIKADARVQEPKGGEIMRVVPRPNLLENMTLDEIKEVFSQLPEALSLLALARTADGTRARYSRLYRTLAMKVPSLRELVSELEKGGALKDGART
uniref:Kinesin motor domain-containing protein n=1 Tax=Kalanchoe fedtschenkoi TaxID=63787 RepID=A0A7N0T783_KALFE